MTTNEWDDVTPVRTPAGKALLHRAHQEGERAHLRINSLEEGFGQVLAELGDVEGRLGKRLAALELRQDQHERHMTEGFSRMGELIEGVHAKLSGDVRKAQDSSNDLSHEVRKMKRIMNIAWPTALVAIAAIGADCTLIVLHEQVPTPIAAIVTAASVLVVAAMQGLVKTKDGQP